MKKNILAQFLQWLGGVWTSFQRFIQRTLRPNRYRRSSKPLNTESAVPISGLEGIEKVPLLTVSDLMHKVKWRLPKQGGVSNSQKKINWD